MKRQKIHKKPRSLLLRIFIFIIKFPFYILALGSTANEKKSSDDEIADIYMNNPRLHNSRPLRDCPRHERY